MPVYAFHVIHEQHFVDAVILNELEDVLTRGAYTVEPRVHDIDLLVVRQQKGYQRVPKGVLHHQDPFPVPHICFDHTPGSAARADKNKVFF